MLLAAAAFLAACVLIEPAIPALKSLTQRAAMISAVITMPEGSLLTLEERFHAEPPLAKEDEKPQPESQPSEPEPAASEAEEKPSYTWPEIPEEQAPPPVQPEIPEEYRGELLSENLAGYAGGPYTIYRNAYIRNYTKLASDEILNILAAPMQMRFEETDAPQVMIMHTHATESYAPFDSDVYDKRYNWRTTDNNNNVVAVGAQLAETLRENGISVLHDTTQHDYPSYTGAYERSEKTVRAYLEQYPTIKVVFDVHRDAIERDGAVIVKPVVEIGGKKAAQLMVMANCDDGSGLIPKWSENFRFAAAITDQLQKDYPDLSRPIFFSYRKYNQQLTTGSLLLEFGSHANTLEEAEYTARLVGESVAKVLNQTKTG